MKTYDMNTIQNIDQLPDIAKDLRRIARSGKAVVLNIPTKFDVVEIEKGNEFKIDPVPFIIGPDQIVLLKPVSSYYINGDRNYYRDNFMNLAVTEPHVSVGCFPRIDFDCAKAKNWVTHMKTYRKGIIPVDPTFFEFVVRSSPI